MAHNSVNPGRIRKRKTSPKSPRASPQAHQPPAGILQTLPFGPAQKPSGTTNFGHFAPKLPLPTSQSIPNVSAGAETSPGRPDGGGCTKRCPIWRGAPHSACSHSFPLTHWLARSLAPAGGPLLTHVQLGQVTAEKTEPKHQEKSSLMTGTRSATGRSAGTT